MSWRFEETERIEEIKSHETHNRETEYKDKIVVQNEHGNRRCGAVEKEGLH